MSRLASSLSLQFALPLAVAIISSPAKAQDLDDRPVGAMLNFGPNLQTTAGGVAGSPPRASRSTPRDLYASPNSDGATTVGHFATSCRI